MPNYFYTAKSFDGQDKSGTMFAKDVSALAQSLKNEKLILVKAISQEEKKKGKRTFDLPFSGASSVEKIMITRNLWIMFAAGLSLVKIFSILGGQARKKKVKDMMLDINERLNKGESFSDALTHYPKVFSDFYLSMVRIGEESGTLEEVFEILSSHMDRDHELKTKVRGAMIYPCIIVIVMLCMGVVVSIFVLPKFTAFLIGMNVPLPIYTRILIGLSDYSQKFWYLAIIAPFVAGYLYLMAIRTKRGKWILDTILLRLPAISGFVKKNNATVLIRSLSSLNESGISLVRALEITSETVGNMYFKKALREALEKVKKGEKLSTALKPYQNLFPLGALDMMEVGEETGKTSLVLKKLSEFYEQEVIEITKDFAVIIEPLLIVVLGLGVAFFAISIIEPMYSSLKSI